MNRLVAHLRCDLTNARRDSLLLYVIISPLLLAVAVALFTPSFGEMKLTLAVERAVLLQKDVEAETLEQYAGVIVADDREELETRVMESDDVPGIALDESGYLLLLQGNEPERIRELATAVTSRLLSGETEDTPFALEHEQMGSRRSFIREILTLMLLMLASLIGGMIAGFNIVEEKTNRITRAFAVSPTRVASYLGAKGAVAGLLGTISSVLSVLIILGTDLLWGRLILTILASTMAGALFGFVMGRFAENQISAMGLNKIIMPLYLTVPIVTIFVPLKFHWAFVVFPQYWLLMAFQNLLVPGLPQFAGFWTSFGLFAGGAAVLVLLMGRMMKRHLGLK